MSDKTRVSQHHVYVIELDKEVVQFDDFMLANPGYKEGMPCLFVGETRHSPRSDSITTWLATRVTNISDDMRDVLLRNIMRV